MPLSTRSTKIPVRELVIFAVLGTIMYISRIIMQGLPSIHVLGLFIASITLVYRTRALVPIYVYVMVEGTFAGFSFWWLPYTYIWLPLWLMFMLAGKFDLSKKVKVPLYMILCGLHGLMFGTLYAPAQALMFGLSFEGMIAWIIAGLPFDITHGVSNFAMGALIVPLSELLKKLDGNNRQASPNMLS